MLNVHLLLIEDSSVKNAALRQLLILQSIPMSVFCCVKSALAYLENHKVNIIVSGPTSEDLNGFEFLRIIRSDNKLMHIPFILLAENITPEEEVAAYLLGVNSIIKKPFNSQLMMAQINGAIMLTEKVVDNYKYTNNITSVDQKTQLNPFLVEFRFFVYNNIDQPIDLDKICAYLNVSRSTLQRKVKQLTGHTVSHEVNTIKIAYAKKIIQNTRYSLKVVASMVGFNSVAYFNVVFKKIEGKTPMESRDCLDAKLPENLAEVFTSELQSPSFN